MQNIGPRIEVVLEARLKRLNPHRIVRECSRECRHQFRDGGVHIVPDPEGIMRAESAAALIDMIGRLAAERAIHPLARFETV